MEALQGSLQHAVRKATSQRQLVIQAVLEAVGDGYLPVSELIQNTKVRKLVKDSGQLSILLSGAYYAGEVGRIDHHEGTTRYAYGKAAGKGIYTKKKEATPTIAPSKDTVSITLEFDNADQALGFLMRNGLISSLVKT